MRVCFPFSLLHLLFALMHYYPISIRSYFRLSLVHASSLDPSTHYLSISIKIHNLLSLIRQFQSKLFVLHFPSLTLSLHPSLPTPFIFSYNS